MTEQSPDRNIIMESSNELSYEDKEITEQSKDGKRRNTPCGSSFPASDVPSTTPTPHCAAPPSPSLPKSEAIACGNTFGHWPCQLRL
jgi:hypothetical protein